ncbi:ScbR family autoregulator-binding transcription factor [Streptomyces glomeratus]|uniref:HTH tetR-type domain-containing protein n=1 Tax=Streptomyces glomeratus TaxID=284452 RepID=A0ABP6M0B8_9ACTN|nr:ScbR family autoregulator-binding transcription factor [Streptomyces glomeratus]MCF1511567.1 TetR/AcrR family transcriptional regulator [Streptomyces glomeratus]
MQDRAEETRRAVLQAAAHLFFERGYAATSISDISERSGRTSGAIYFHYTNKEQLALAVVEAHFATWPALVAHHAAAPESTLRKLVRLSFAVARAFRDDVLVRAGARLWAERRSIAVQMPPPFVDWIATVEGMLTQARAEGDLAPHAEPGRDAPTLVAAFFGLHTLSDALDERVLIEDRLTDLWLLLLPGLQADPAPQALLAEVSGRATGRDDGHHGDRIHRAAGPHRPASRPGVISG